VKKIDILFPLRDYREGTSDSTEDQWKGREGISDLKGDQNFGEERLSAKKTGIRNSWVGHSKSKLGGCSSYAHRERIEDPLESQKALVSETKKGNYMGKTVGDYRKKMNWTPDGLQDQRKIRWWDITMRLWVLQIRGPSKRKKDLKERGEG